MKTTLIVTTMLAFTAAVPVVHAGDAKTTGLVGGAATGAVLGGPVGAVVGGAVGLTTGAVLEDDNKTKTVIVKKQPDVIIQRQQPDVVIDDQ